MFPEKHIPTLLSQYEASDAARGIQADADTPPEVFFDALMEQKLYTDAVYFLSCGLLIRENVFWGLKGIEEFIDLSQGEPVFLEAFEKIQEWMRAPSDPLRRGIEALFRPLSNKTDTLIHPLFWLGKVVFWSGGSISDENAPPTYPGERLSPGAMGGCILLLANYPHRKKLPALEEREAVLLSLLSLGRKVAEEGVSF